VTEQETFQLSLQAAWTYEERFVPAIFAEWAPRLARLAGVRPGQRVLDAACGTGVVARACAELVGSSGSVTGLDLNASMLTVARQLRPDLTWRQGDVCAMPFDGGAFDVVLCQMALMFLPDRVAALRELGRVCTRNDGVVGVVVPAALADQPAYGPLVRIAARHAGPSALSLLGAYWSCGEVKDLTAWCERAGLQVLGLRTERGVARFASPDELVATEVEASPLAERIDATTYRRIRDDAREQLAGHVDDDGRFAPPLVAHLVVATRG
jgi:SAM-dependent methyltransferase